MNWLLVFFPIAIVLEAFAPERPLFLIFGHSAPRRVDGQVHRTTCQPDGRRRWRASGSARTDQSSDVFVGVFVVAILGNAAEHATAISAALKDRMDLALSIAIGSSVQVALFVAPVLVLASFFLGPTSKDLTFPRGLILMVLLSALITSQVAGDGRSDWLKGLQLLAVYLIFGLAFFFLPSAPPQ